MDAFLRQNNLYFNLSLNLTTTLHHELLLRPPDVSRNGLNILPLSFIFSLLGMPWPNSRSGDPAKVYQRFGPRLNLINPLRHFAPLVHLNFPHFCVYLNLIVPHLTVCIVLVINGTRQSTLYRVPSANVLAVTCCDGPLLPVCAYAVTYITYSVSGRRFRSVSLGIVTTRWTSGRRGDIV